LPLHKLEELPTPKRLRDIESIEDVNTRPSKSTAIDTVQAPRVTTLKAIRKTFRTNKGGIKKSKPAKLITKTAEAGSAKPKKARALTPLQRFKSQTLTKRSQLKKARADIDKELKAIEKDLGVLKRKKK
jgi:hypothetical protein